MGLRTWFFKKTGVKLKKFKDSELDFSQENIVESFIRFFLKDKGYIQIHQIGSTKFVWVLGKEAVQKDYDLYAPKRMKDKEAFAKK